MTTPTYTKLPSRRIKEFEEILMNGPMKLVIGEDYIRVQIAAIRAYLDEQHQESKEKQ